MKRKRIKREERGEEGEEELNKNRVTWKQRKREEKKMCFLDKQYYNNSEGIYKRDTKQKNKNKGL